MDQYMQPMVKSVRVLWPPEAGMDGLRPCEREWVGLAPYLESKGYMLRPRYQPGWEKTWPREFVEEHGEDIWALREATCLDATRMSDGRLVLLKRYHTGSQEYQLAKQFGSPEMLNDPRNHSMPVLDTIELPGHEEMCLLVHPLLRSVIERFETVGCCLKYIHQTLEGLAFMHENRVAHGGSRKFWIGDTTGIVQDTKTAPHGFHPQMHEYAPNGYDPCNALSRVAVGGVQYTFNDFSSSVDLDAHGASWAKRCQDPAQLDVWGFGAHYSTLLLENGFHYCNIPTFVERILKDMVAPVSRRPSSAQVLQRFEEEMASWSIRNIASHMRARTGNENCIAGLIRDVIHPPRYLIHVVKGKKARKHAPVRPTQPTCTRDPLHTATHASHIVTGGTAARSVCGH